jgi:hypothetical protein
MGGLAASDASVENDPQGDVGGADISHCSKPLP